MKKLMATILLTTLTLIAIAITIYAANDTFGINAANDISVTAEVEGSQVAFEGMGPIIVDGRTLVPVLGVFEQLGFYVQWDGQLRQVALTRGDYVVIITIDSYIFTINDQSHSLDVPAQIIEGSTMLPIRAVLEGVGYHVFWYEPMQIITVWPQSFFGETADPIDELDDALSVADIPDYIPGDIPDYITIGGEQFSTSLTELRLRLSELPELPNEYESLAVLRYMVNLTDLNIAIGYAYNVIGHTSIVSEPFNMQFLEELVNLENLTLIFNQKNDLTPISGLTNLRLLDLSFSHLTDVTFLAGLYNLEQLFLFDNEITDITPLAGLYNLQTLDLTANQVTDISPLTELANLSWLNLNMNQITDITPLAGLSNLRWMLLSLSGNQMADLDFILERLYNLEGLDLVIDF